eukprot:1152321-Pelagomonas_calceolata.AAC.4
MLYYTHTILFGMGRRKENYVGSDNIPHISEGKEDPKGRGTVHLLHQERKKNSMGIGGFTSSTPCLILVTRFERGFLKSASRKFIGGTSGNCVWFCWDCHGAERGLIGAGCGVDEIAKHGLLGGLVADLSLEVPGVSWCAPALATNTELDMLLFWRRSQNWTAQQAATQGARLQHVHGAQIVPCKQWKQRGGGGNDSKNK